MQIYNESLTLEHDGNVHAKHFLLANPDRLVVDVDGTELNATLKELISKIQPDDPYIQQVRVGQLNPKTVRLVFDLKTAVNPQVFSLAPIDKYKHRLVLDLYPKEPLDPIAALIMKGEWKNDPEPVQVAASTPKKSSRPMEIDWKKNSNKNAGKNNGGDFEDILSKFLKESEERFQDLKKHQDFKGRGNKKNSLTR